MLARRRTSAAAPRSPAGRSSGLVDPRKALDALRRRRDHRLPGPAPLPPPAHRPGRPAGAGARAPLPGQRLPHPARLAGLRGAQRQPRRVRLPDPRHQAVGGAPPARRAALRPRDHAETAASTTCCSGPGSPCTCRPERRTPPARRTTPSLHVTIGINQLTWRGLVRRTVDQLLDEVDDQHLPAGWVGRPRRARRPVSSTGSRPWPSRWPTSTRPRPSTARSERFLDLPQQPAAGGLHDVLAVDRIGPDTVLRRRAGRPCVVSPVGDRLRLLIGDRSVEVPSPDRRGRRRGPRPRDPDARRPRLDAAEQPRAGAPPRPGGPARGPRVTADPSFRCSAAGLDARTPSRARPRRSAPSCSIENPGPWGVDAVRDSRLPAPVKAGLRAAAAAREGATPAHPPLPPARAAHRVPRVRRVGGARRAAGCRPRPRRPRGPPRPRPRGPGRRPLARAGADRGARCSACAPTASTTPAAPRRAGRSRRRWRRRTPRRPGRSPTSAATGSPATRWCCRYGLYLGRLEPESAVAAAARRPRRTAAARRAARPVLPADGRPGGRDRAVPAPRRDRDGRGPRARHRRDGELTDRRPRRGRGPLDRQRPHHPRRRRAAHLPGAPTEPAAAPRGGRRRAGRRPLTCS